MDNLKIYLDKDINKELIKSKKLQLLVLALKDMASL